MDINQTYCGDHFVIYTNTESLYCIPETNIMLYVNYTSMKKTKRKMLFKNKKREFTII